MNNKLLDRITISDVKVSWAGIGVNDLFVFKAEQESFRRWIMRGKPGFYRRVDYNVNIPGHPPIEQSVEMTNATMYVQDGDTYTLTMNVNVEVAPYFGKLTFLLLIDVKA
jgi:hypothetical protein